MKTLFQLEDFVHTTSPISLTIGNFDGVHLGHQAILSSLKERKVVFTFSNHPAEVLKNQSIFRLTTTLHRLQLIENYGVDTTIVMPFTVAFSKQSPEYFLTYLRSMIPFSHLVLGHDAVIGHARQGNAQYLHSLAKKLNFSLHYLDPITVSGTTVSSTGIRKHIQKGNFALAHELLGRPYSIMTTVEPGTQQGRLLGFHTANLHVHTLCLPPLGVYVVQTQIKEKKYLGVANLGRAPTFHAHRPPLLEVHLMGFEGDLYQQPIEVVFLKFLRPEIRFESTDALKIQIQKDIDSALLYYAQTIH